VADLELPESRFERGLLLLNLMTQRATGGVADDAPYQALRREFMADPALSRLLPPYVRTCRDMAAFWPVAKGIAPSWEGRRVQLREDFEPLLSTLEAAGVTPLDDHAGSVLSAFSPEGVDVVWRKAMDRRATDPEGAITSARTLLESVCKHILVEAEVKFRAGEPLPKLYEKTATLLKLTPDQHAHDALATILEGCTAVVGGLGNLRNSFSDAHAPSPTPCKKPVRPTVRHAQLAVNLAGAMATFLVETWLVRADRA